MKKGNKAPRGFCPYCWRERALCADGTLRGHPCAGSPKGYHPGGAMPMRATQAAAAARLRKPGGD